MNLNNLTIKSQEAVQRAQQLAMENSSQAIELGHLLKGIFEVDDSVTPFVFKKMGVNLNAIQQATNSIVRSYARVDENAGQYLSRQTNEALQKANSLLKDFGDEYVALEHLLLAILSVKDSVSQMLKDSGVTEKDLRAAIQDLRKGSTVQTASAAVPHSAATP